MKTAILLFVLVLFFIIYYSTNLNKTKFEVKESKVEENPYYGLRKKVFNIDYQELKLQLNNPNDLYGIVMDWNMGDVVVTVVAFKTGDASVYLNSGQVFIGGYAHKSIISAAIEFVESGQSYLTKAVEIEQTPMPNEQKIRFYFLTKSAKLYLEEDVSLVENNKSDLSKLFNLGNKIITEYRLITG